MDVFDIQKNNFTLLKNALEGDKLHHAYIFYGPKGSGKMKFALEFVRYVHCQNKKDSGPCGECQSCKVNKDGFIKTGYVLDKEGDIGVDDIREMKKSIDLTAFDGSKKFIIMNNFHNVTKREIYEMVLKDIEEPPEGTIMVLITDNINLLPRTILSRCSTIYFSRPTKENYEKVISDQGIEKKTLDISYLFSLGNMSFFDDEEKAKLDYYKKEIEDLEKVFFEENIFERMMMAKKIDEEGDIKEKVENWMSVLYGIFLYKQGALVFDMESEKALEVLEKRLDCDRIVRVLENLERTRRLLGTNASKLLLLENFLLNI